MGVTLIKKGGMIVNGRREDLIHNIQGVGKMTAYITYMKMKANTRDATFRQIEEVLKRHQWKPIYGKYDYAYEWDINGNSLDKNMQEFFNHIHRTHEALKNLDVDYSLRTYREGKEDPGL